MKSLLLQDIIDVRLLIMDHCQKLAELCNTYQKHTTPDTPLEIIQLKHSTLGVSNIIDQPVIKRFFEAIEDEEEK